MKFMKFVNLLILSFFTFFKVNKLIKIKIRQNEGNYSNFWKETKEKNPVFNAKVPLERVD